VRRGCVIPYAPAYSTTQLLRTFRGKRGKRGKRDMNDFKHLSLFAWSLQIGMEIAIYDRKGEEEAVKNCKVNWPRWAGRFNKRKLAIFCTTDKDMDV
jgi:hypothetical protein